MKKKLIIVTVLCLMIPLSAFPQKSLGLSSGVIYSGVLSKGDTGISRLPILRYTEELTGFYDFNKRWFLTFGLTIEKKGFKAEFYTRDAFGQKVDGPFYVSQELEYLTVPLLLNIRSKGKIQFYTGLGAHLSFLLKATSVEPLLEPLYDQNGVPLFEWKVIGETRKPVTENYKLFDISFAWQGGIIYPVATNLMLNFNLSLTHGVIPITKKEKFQNVKYYSRSGGAQLGVLYTW